MNAGLLRGFGEFGETDEGLAVPKRLAIATSTTTQTGITTITDLTGLAISFAHTDARFDVEVELYLPYNYGSALNAFIIATIATSGNTALQGSGVSVSGTSHVDSLRVTYLITTLGSYSLKARGSNGTGTGTVAFGVGSAEYTAHLKATEVRKS